MNFELFGTYAPRLLGGLFVTLQLVFTSAIIGFMLSVPLALARDSRLTITRWLVKLYIVLFRGTPLLGQLFLVYYGASQIRDELSALGLWWFFRDGYNCAVLVFTLNTTAYQAEIVRGAITSVPRGQKEAAKSLGLGPIVTFVKVIFPQAAIMAVRPLSNELIFSLKASALASVVTVPDFMQVTKLVFSRSFEFQVYLWAAVVYFVMVETIRRACVILERYLSRHIAAQTRPSSEASSRMMTLRRAGARVSPIVPKGAG
ncbi:ABC transporter permease [Rhizobium multihospitium]|uniref:Polar amino acid transport system permease protein n=1 Tax=Rhizobium multihospitium TaxID=410764 RepID=A0A1C3X590_9HYPH|nr:ABC transporter permease subunit [Rhizobium multihospitium]SCB47423.1 polar amino acid transport system permease protein [Rhizobium multihospitium]